MDSGSDVKLIVSVLEHRVEAPTIPKLLADAPATASKTRKEYLAGLDKFLNFFNCLHDAIYSAKTLDIEELRVFGWYLDLILQDGDLVKYCKENGYADVLALAKAVTARRQL